MMQKKIILTIVTLTLLIIVRCSTNTQSENTTQIIVSKTGTADKENQLTHPLDEEMVDKGEHIYKAKCIGCHKLTKEKLVGPGWKGETNRRTPEWIINALTNTNVKMDSSLVAQQLMEVCIARMPDQNLSYEDARYALEFMRKNDGKN
jgi:hypothetical protein